jgi:LytS/YehU family sensor histidine kinase
VPPLLLQPLVENSLKHGCAADGRPLRLALEALSEGGWVSLRFTDDGAPNGRVERGLGVGLENLDQRVRRFGGAGASMTATRLQGGGFAVTMRWRAVPAATPERSVTS